MNDQFQKTNTLAIIGFILSIFIFPVGLVLCIIALFQIKKRGEKGIALAVIGLVWSLLLTVIIAFVAVLLKVYILPNLEDFAISLVCDTGAGNTIKDEDGSVVCGDVVDGEYTCEFTIDGETDKIVCEIEE